MRVHVGGSADAVVVGDGEVVVEHPGGRVRGGQAAQVGGEGVEVGHVAVGEQQVVPRAVNVVGHLVGRKRRCFNVS